ncbi:MAG: AIPR family protein [Deltaproteobacteria bacterium]|nr:AIPR family protein [Deltaproteobacteria bacterium]
MCIEEIKNSIISTYNEYIEDNNQIPNFFVPWFIHKKFQISLVDALQYSSSGAEDTGRYDCGIDGFFIESIGNDKYRLWIFQGKLTDDRNLILKGFDDVVKASKAMRNILMNQDTGQVRENNVIVSLRRNLFVSGQLISIEEIAFCLLTAADIDAISMDKRYRDKENKTNNGIAENIGQVNQVNNVNYRYSLSSYGSNHLRGYIGVRQTIMGENQKIRFEGQEVIINENIKFFVGLTYLSDLISLYERFRNNLFDKNVRFFLRRQAIKEESASSKIKESLRKICVNNQLSENLFPLMHNGVYIYASDGQQNSEQKEFILIPGSSGIFILNGCQTIFSAYSFLVEEGKKQQFSRDRWNNIKIPCKIIITDDENLTNTVAINSNRQTTIQPSAFWSNHSTQRKIQFLLSEKGVYYERQEGAFDTISREFNFTNNYPNGVIKMAEMARIIAAANKNLPIELALKPNKIFDYEDNYKKVFDDQIFERENIAAILISFYNIYNAIHKWIKRDERQYMREIEPSKFAPAYFRVLVNMIFHRRSNDTLRNLIVNHNSRAYRNNLNDNDLYRLTNNIGTIINNHIQNVMREYFYIERQIESGNYYEWIDPSTERLRTVISTFARNSRIDVFDTSILD